MKRMMIISAMMVAMSMSSGNASAQAQGRGRDNRKARVERRDSRPGNMVETTAPLMWLMCRNLHSSTTVTLFPVAAVWSSVLLPV